MIFMVNSEGEEVCRVKVYDGFGQLVGWCNEGGDAPWAERVNRCKRIALNDWIHALDVAIAHDTEVVENLKQTIKSATERRDKAMETFRDLEQGLKVLRNHQQEAGES